LLLRRALTTEKPDEEVLSVGTIEMEEVYSHEAGSANLT